MDIVPEKPRSVADALAIAQACGPGHVLVAWVSDGEDGEEVLNVLTGKDGGDDLTNMEVVYLCERIKLVQLGAEVRVGPIKP